MRKGRGLVDIDIYNELLKVPGASAILVENITNHRTDPRTGKLRAEIHEDAWKEVKKMVANWKRFKKGETQIVSPVPAKKVEYPKTNATPVVEKKEKTDEQDLIRKIKNLKPGDTFAYKNTGFGLVSYERGDDIIERKKGKLITDTFDHGGMEWTGNTWKFDGGLGLVTTIVLLEQVPPGKLV